MRDCAGALTERLFWLVVVVWVAVAGVSMARRDETTKSSRSLYKCEGIVTGKREKRRAQSECSKGAEQTGFPERRGKRSDVASSLLAHDSLSFARASLPNRQFVTRASSSKKELPAPSTVHINFDRHRPRQLLLHVRIPPPWPRGNHQILWMLIVSVHSFIHASCLILSRKGSEEEGAQEGKVLPRVRWCLVLMTGQCSRTRRSVSKREILRL